MAWRRLGPSHATAADALAGSLAALEGAQPDDPATVAWWLVERDALVLGRGSTVAADTAACAAAGVEVVRRSSGGGPVLWGPDLLAVDVIVPRDHPLHSDDVVDSYRLLGEAMTRAIMRLGAPARAVDPAETRSLDSTMGALSCFAALSPWEVVIDDRKAVGLSQVRRRTGTLLQAGILLDVDGARLTSLLDLTPTARHHLARTLAERATGLHEHIAAGHQEIIDAVSDAITEAG